MYSASLETPTASAEPNASFMWGLNPEEYAIGSFARSNALTKTSAYSRCETNRTAASFVTRARYQ